MNPVDENDLKIRQIALSEAARIAWNHGFSPAEIVDTAAKFEAFLRGKAPQPIKEAA